MTCVAQPTVSPFEKGRRRGRQCDGFTLVELIVVIIVLSISILGVSGLLTALAARSSDTLASAQATFIASAYLEEVLSEPFQDPNVNGEISRSTYDDVWDYRNHDDLGALDHLENAIAGLDQFRISVRVINVQLGPAAFNVPARRIDVTVTSPGGSRTTLSGYRTNYVGQVLLQ